VSEKKPLIPILPDEPAPRLIVQEPDPETLPEQEPPDGCDGDSQEHKTP
jgi:hypothetical protein